LKPLNSGHEKCEVYARFEQAYAENETRVGPWKEKSDLVKVKTDSILTYISNIKEELVKKSGYKPYTGENPIQSNEFYLATAEGRYTDNFKSR
jgi:hypothetical protein